MADDPRLKMKSNLPKAPVTLKTGKKTYAAPYIPSDIGRAVHLGNPHIDNLYEAVMALGANLWAAQRRLRIHEAVMAKHGKLTPELVEQYLPTKAEQDAWNDERNAMITQIFDSGTRSQDLGYAAELHPPIKG